MDDDLRPSETWRRPWPLFEVTDGCSTFGAPLSLADEATLADELDRAAAHHEVTVLSNADIGTKIDRDHEIALATRRWVESPDGALIQSDTSFVPGDVGAIRSSATKHLADAAPGLDRARGPVPNKPAAIKRAATMTRLVYAARPYWLPHASAWGVMAIKPLTTEDLSALLLPGPALVLFSAGMEITTPYIGTDLRLADRLNYVHDLDPHGRGASSDPSEHPPLNVRSGTTGILRYYSELSRGSDPEKLLFHYQLIGVLLLPDQSGAPTDAVVWVLRRINPNVGATSRHVAVGKGLSVVQSSSTFTFVEGRLSAALLSPIAQALTAVTAWGAWDPPDDPEPSFLHSGDLRKLARKSAFKKAERRGTLAGVHVLSARTPTVGSEHYGPDTGRRLTTHYRVGHWQRYRVGPRTDWHYERRQIPGMIINPGLDELGDIVRIYRLPPPPWTDDPDRVSD